MIDQYRSNVESFCEKWTREHYLHAAGLKASLELSSIYSEYSDLFRPQAIAELKTAAENVPEHFSSKRKGLKRLLGFALLQHLQAKTRKVTESIIRETEHLRLSWDGRQLNVAEAFQVLCLEPDSERRRELGARRRAALRRLDSLFRERWILRRTTAQELGFESCLALQEEVSGLDYSEIAALARAFLAATRETYEEQLIPALREHLGLEVFAARDCDIHFFRGLARHSEHFKAGGLLGAFGETTERLGIDITRLNNLQIDLDNPSLRRGESACFPIRIPGEIRWISNCWGGYADYASFFHEGGHSLHHAWSSPALPVESRRCRDAALGEVYADLFQDLLDDTGWLWDRLNFSESEEFARLRAVHKLFEQRRIAAMISLGVEWYGHRAFDDGTWAAVAAETLAEATLFHVADTQPLEELDMELGSADHFRAWVIEAQLEEHLRSRFGHKWYSERRAGDLLKEIWETGELYTADEMARELGLQTSKVFSLEDYLRQNVKHGHY